MVPEKEKMNFNFKFKKLDFGKKVLSNLQFNQPVLGRVTNNNVLNNIFKQNIVNDIKSKNSQIYLRDKSFKTKNSIAYVHSDPTNQNIFIGNEANDIDFNDIRNLNHLAHVIGHEEMHNVLKRDVSVQASKQLDKISPKTLFVPREGKEVLAHKYGREPKEILFPSEFVKDEKQFAEETKSKKYTKVISPNYYYIKSEEDIGNKP